MRSAAAVASLLAFLPPPPHLGTALHSPSAMSDDGGAKGGDAGTDGVCPDRPPWDAVTAEYERRVEPFTRRFAEEMVRPFFDEEETASAEAAAESPGGGRKRRRKKLLDLGCGTGALSLLALSRGFDVTATDASESMVERVRRRAADSGIDGIDGDGTAAARGRFRAVVSDGQSLPPEWDRTYDYAAAAFSVIFFPDPAAGLREMHRCLVPGGTAAITAWGDRSETPAFQVFPDAAAEVIPGEASKGRPRRITGSIEALTSLMAEAGFVDVRVVGPVTNTLEVASPGAYYDRFALTSPPTIATLQSMDGPTRERFRSLVMEIAKERGGRDDGTVGIDSSAYIAYGKREH